MKKISITILIIMTGLCASYAQTAQDRISIAKYLTLNTVEEGVDLYAMTGGVDAEKLIFITSTNFGTEEDFKSFLYHAKWDTFEKMFDNYAFTQMCFQRETVQCFSKQTLKVVIEAID